MDQPYIDALVNQALGAYKAGGDEGLKRWKQALPAPHLTEFERDCSERLQEAIKALYAPLKPELEQAEDELPPAELHSEVPPEALEGPDEREVKTQPDPRKKHTRDRRRTKPL